MVVTFELNNKSVTGYAWNRNGAWDIGALGFTNMGERSYIEARSLARKQWLVKCGFYLATDDALAFFKTVLEQHGYTVQEATDEQRGPDQRDG